MELTIQTFLIVCPLVFLAGLVDSIAGGGGLISLPAYLLAGVPMHNAIATNKLSSATGTAISTARLCKNKFVDWGVALPCISMALVGSFAGAHIALLARRELTIQTFLIVCPLVFLAGLVDSIAGGGGLISLPAYLLAGVPMHNAIATNKLSSATGTAISTARLCKNKFVDWGVALPCISMALVGSFAGAHIALLASDKILKWMLIPVLPIVAFYVMKKKNLDDNSNVEISRKKQWILCAVCSLAVGCYDGFYGPGTGTFLLILYTGVAKLPVAKASGTMKLANLSSNIMALVVFLFSGKIVIYLGLAASVFSIAGHYVGSGMVMKNGNKIVRPIILIVLVLLFIKIITGM